MQPTGWEHRNAKSSGPEASSGWGSIADRICLPCVEGSALLQLPVRQWGLAIYIGSILNTTQSHRVTENSQTINRNAHCRLDFAKRNREFPHK